MNPEEPSQWIARLCDGELSPEEARRWVAACRRDPALLQAVSEHVALERLLSYAHQYPDVDCFVREVSARLKTVERVPAGKIIRFPATAWRGSIAVAAVLVGLLLVGTVYWMRMPEASVGVVMHTEAAKWSDGQLALIEGTSVKPGAVRLESGFAELRLGASVKLILEGPAHLEVRNAQRCFLHQGKAVVRVEKSGRGFILDGPRGRLVDLGTEFAVSVQDSGDMETHVLEGLVEARASGQRETLQLRRDEALQWTANTAQRLPADPLAFVTALPTRGKTQVGYVHWAFDEAQGDYSPNLGQGLAETSATAWLRSERPGNPGPTWVTGPFGGALAFDGQDDYVESDFPGIAGGEPRTVAFWVKVPGDFDVSQGFGIVGWGSLRESGSAWQISVNPNAPEGPVGSLRVGVHRGSVVGRTDLRDDRWHHVAVVMYGGTQPDISTHVLLYLDGRLEPTARKAVREIYTDTRSDKARSVWLGRNLDPAGYRKAWKFFRGSADEVYIFNTALSQSQVLGLMQQNRFVETH